MAENAKTRLAAYKNLAKNSEDLRQRRLDTTIELRKNKKDDQLLKRRNIEKEEPASPLQESNGQAHSPVQSLTLDEIVASINCGVPQKEFNAVQAVRKMLSREKNPPIDTVIELGLVPKLIKYLENFDDIGLQFEAAWALTNIASGTAKQTRVVIDHGGVPKFVALLTSKAPNVAEQAVWALGNIAGDGSEARDVVLNHRTVEYLLKILGAPHVEVSFIRNIVWLMSNLCRNKNPTPPFEKVQQMLPALSHLLDYEDKIVLADCCWALSYVTDDTPEKTQAVVDAGCVPKLVRLLECNDIAIVTPALRSVGNIVTGNDQQTDAVLSSGALKSLVGLLQHKKNNIIKEAAWTVSNITAGNQQQIQAVMDSGLIQPLIEVLKFGDFKAQREAVWAITNITSGGATEQTVHLIEKFAFLTHYCDLLASNDSRTVAVILNGLQNMFKTAETINGVESLCMLVEENGGLDKLEALQNHELEEIYQKAFQLIDTYFSEDDGKSELAPKEEDGILAFNIMNNQNGGDNQFNF